MTTSQPAAPPAVPARVVTVGARAAEVLVVAVPGVWALAHARRGSVAVPS